MQRKRARELSSVQRRNERERTPWMAAFMLSFWQVTMTVIGDVARPPSACRRIRKTISHQGTMGCCGSVEKAAADTYAEGKARATAGRPARARRGQEARGEAAAPGIPRLMSSNQGPHLPVLAARAAQQGDRRVQQSEGRRQDLRAAPDAAALAVGQEQKAATRAGEAMQLSAGRIYMISNAFTEYLGDVSDGCLEDLTEAKEAIKEASKAIDAHMTAEIDNDKAQKELVVSEEADGGGERGEGGGGRGECGRREQGPRKAAERAEKAKEEEKTEGEGVEQRRRPVRWPRRRRRRSPRRRTSRRPRRHHGLQRAHGRLRGDRQDDRRRRPRRPRRWPDHGTSRSTRRRRWVDF